MARPLVDSTLNANDVKDIPSLIQSLNPILGRLAGSLNNGLSFGDNFRCTIRAVTFTAPEEWVLIQPSGSPIGVAWANGWMTNTNYGPAAYRRTLDGRVFLRGVGRRTALPSPATPMLIRLPGASDLESLRPNTSSGPGAADLNRSGTLIWYGGGPEAWPLSALAYDPADRSLPVWDTPLEVVLPKDFTAKPQRLLPLSCQEENGTPVAPVSLGTWTTYRERDDPSKTGLRISRVLGVAPGLKYTLTLLVLAE